MEKLPKSFEEANEMQPVNADVYHVLSFIENLKTEDKDVLAAQALLKLFHVTRVLNDNKEADWEIMERKYFNWFNLSAFGFSYYLCATWITCTSAPYRLSFRDSEVAKHAGNSEKILELYKQLML